MRSFGGCAVDGKKLVVSCQRVWRPHKCSAPERSAGILATRSVERAEMTALVLYQSFIHYPRRQWGNEQAT